MPTEEEKQIHELKSKIAAQKSELALLEKELDTLKQDSAEQIQF